MAVTEADKQQALMLHNEARAAVNLPPLTYCSKLASHAQAWAETNLRARDMYHSDTRSRRVKTSNRWDQVVEGENLASCTGWGADTSVTFATEEWIAEKRNIRNGRATGMVGHYTQVIYEDCSKVGFGLARDRAGVYVVARYDNCQTGDWSNSKALTFKGPSSKSKPKPVQTQNTGESSRVGAAAGGWPAGSGFSGLPGFAHEKGQRSAGKPKPVHIQNKRGESSRAAAAAGGSGFSGWHGFADQVGQSGAAARQNFMPPLPKVAWPLNSNQTGQGGSNIAAFLGQRGDAFLPPFNKHTLKQTGQGFGGVTGAGMQHLPQIFQDYMLDLATGKYPLIRNDHRRQDSRGNIYTTTESNGVTTVTKTMPDGKVTKLTGAEAAKEIGRARKT